MMRIRVLLLLVGLWAVAASPRNARLTKRQESSVKAVLDDATEKFVAKLVAAAPPGAIMNRTGAAGDEVQAAAFLAGGQWIAQWDAANANDYFWWLIAVGIQGLQSANGEFYYRGPSLVLLKTGQQPVCVQNEMGKFYENLAKDTSPWKVLNMLMKAATFVVGLADPAMWVTEVYNGVQSLVKNRDPFMDFWGIEPAGTSPNPDTVFVCDCAVMCQVAYLQNLKDPNQLAKFADCVGMPSNLPSSPYLAIKGQQWYLEQYLRVAYRPEYLSFLKRYAQTMNVRSKTTGEILTPLVKAREMLLAMEPQTFASNVLATPAFAKCAATNTRLMV